MQYLAGLLVFSGIGSFLISDTIDFGRELKKNSSRSRLYSDFFRLLVLGGMALIGYMVASETFQKPNRLDSMFSYWYNWSLFNTHNWGKAKSY